MNAAHHTGSDRMRIQLMQVRRTCVCYATLAIALAPGIGLAREVRMQSPNGDGGGSSIELPDTAGNAPALRRKGDTTVTPPPDTAKIPPMVRSADETSTNRQPRWHSFLPGMLR